MPALADVFGRSSRTDLAHDTPVVAAKLRTAPPGGASSWSLVMRAIAPRDDAVDQGNPEGEKSVKGEIWMGN